MENDTSIVFGILIENHGALSGLWKIINSGLSPSGLRQEVLALRSAVRLSLAQVFLCGIFDKLRRLPLRRNADLIF
jgi:hypothetical protein